jgi:signal peptidase I
MTPTTPMTLLVTTLALAAVGLGLVLPWCRRSLAVVTVLGPSMAPAFSDGDRVLVRRKSLSRIRRGEVVLVERPGTETGWFGEPASAGLAGRHWIIKRAAALPGDPLSPDQIASWAAGAETVVPTDRLVVLGDSPNQSYDSRDFGFVEPERLFGVVLRRLARPADALNLSRARSGT